MTSQAPSSLAATIGLNIKTARAASGLTQRQLADRVDVDPMLVSKWERGQHRPSDGNLSLVAAATVQELAWFYTRHERTAA